MNEISLLYVVVNSWLKITTFRGCTALWWPRAQVFLNLENRDLDHRSLRLMLKILYAASSCLSQLISVQFALKCVSQPKIAKKSIKLLFWRSRSSKVIEFGGNWSPVYDFLSVINSNLCPISHRCWDTATYWLKITIFSTPLSFSAFVRNETFRIYGKALRFL